MKFPLVTPTPHNSALKGEIAEVVLLFSDPDACKRYAEHFLKNCKEVSSVRGNWYFTGEYNGKTVTFGTSGMGKGSTGIYAYELYAFYDVKTIINIGTSRAYTPDLAIGDKIFVAEAVDDTSYFSRVMAGEYLDTLFPNADLKDELLKSGEKLGVKLHECRVHSTDIYYFARPFSTMAVKTNTKCTDMESQAVFSASRRIGRRAASLLVITDALHDNTKMTTEQRSVACNPIIEVALNIL